MFFSSVINKFAFGFELIMSWACLLVTGAIWAIHKRSTVCVEPVGVFMETVCCADCDGWQLGKIDRIIHVSLAFIGVFVNVVPKYVKEDLAHRHLKKVGIQRWWNPLLVHIISGTFTVLPAGLSGVFGWQSSPGLLRFIMASSLVHDLTIYGLLPNHDGIWALRADNLAMAVQKTIIVFAPMDPVTKTDLLFFLAFGFMGTRMFSYVWAILNYLSLPSTIVDEYWYSLGLACAHFYPWLRIPQVYQTIAFPCYILAAMLCYHKRWNRKYQPLFIASLVAMMAVALYGPLAGHPRRHTLLLLAFHLWTFTLPFWRRRRLSDTARLAKEQQQQRAKEEKSANVPEREDSREERAAAATATEPENRETTAELKCQPTRLPFVPSTPVVTPMPVGTPVPLGDESPSCTPLPGSSLRLLGLDGGESTDAGSSFSVSPPSLDEDFMTEPKQEIKAEEQNGRFTVKQEEEAPLLASPRPAPAEAPLVSPRRFGLRHQGRFVMAMRASMMF